VRSLGGLLFFLGAGSVVLHMLNAGTFLFLSPLQPYQPIAGIVVAVIGVVLIALGEQRDRATKVTAVSEREVAAVPASEATVDAEPREVAPGDIERRP